MAGIYDSDDEMIRDMKLMNWIGTQKYKCIEQFGNIVQQANFDKAKVEDIEILILKEK
jgi:hypothetical protein